MIIYVDIDETICEYPGGTRQYHLAEPIHENIDKVNRLYEEGNTIIYWTARGSITRIDYEELTKQQLRDWGVKYHDLRLNKPHYDLFICDKAANTGDYFGDE